jgi:hypothetical protein
MGVPVTTHFIELQRFASASNPTSIPPQIFEFKRFALPGIAFDS